MALGSTGITGFEDLKTTPLFVGGTGDTADTVQFPKIINAIFGTQMEIINGYPGGNDVTLAMERGEVDGAAAGRGRRSSPGRPTRSPTARSFRSCSFRPANTPTCGGAAHHGPDRKTAPTGSF